MHGHGLFTSKDVDSSYAGMLMEGYFYIDLIMDQLLQAVKSDGVPWYAVGDTDTLRKLCTPNKAMREGAVLCLRPDQSSPWFYIN